MNIRNFSIIAHIDHGKSTLADRLLEVTGTIEKRKMRERVLDQMDLERERGITIKMAPVRMEYHPNRGLARTIEDADWRGRKSGTGLLTSADSKLLYEDLTYKIRGAAYAVKHVLGVGQKESIYQKALEIEFAKIGLSFERERVIDIFYDAQKVGVYRPDFVVENKIVVELKSLPFLGKNEKTQTYHYLKGSPYEVAFLINFGGNDIEFERFVFASARSLRQSALSLQGSADQIKDETYILNLIDTPGHIDFSYEVSRAIKAVEGAILLVDATQGIQAQTLSVLEMAQKQNLTIIPVLNKIDLAVADVEGVGQEVMRLLGCRREDILHVSGKTGQGVPELLQAIIERIPPPASINAENSLRALIFDFSYSTHRGVIVFARIFDGKIKKGDKIKFSASGRDFIVHSLGVFKPEEVPVGELGAGEIGLIVTGVKEPGVASVGDTLVSVARPLPALPGYLKPTPVVWASLYPENQDDFPLLKQGLARLQLSDSSLDFEEEASGTLGRGFRCGFLGMLHLEIITERLRREAKLKLIVASPTITYIVEKNNGKKETIYSAAYFPDDGTYKTVWEPWVAVTIITPPQYVGAISQLFHKHEAIAGDVESFGEHRMALRLDMPLRELMRNFFDEVKSVSSGYGSLSYLILPPRVAAITRLDVLLADEVQPALARVVSRTQAEGEAEEVVEKLVGLMPRQLFELKIQARAFGRIMASRKLSAMRKDVTGYLYGGDITRKMKLLEKQKRGKKRMKQTGKVTIPQDVFLKLTKAN